MSQTDILKATTAEKLQFVETILATDAFWDHQEELVELIQDPVPEVRERSLAAFWEISDPIHIDRLITIAREDPALNVRRAAIAVLGRYIYEGFVIEELEEPDYNEVKDALLELHRNPDEPLDVRRTALEALGFITDDEIEGLIREAYASADPQMRISAIFAMGRSGTRTWDEFLTSEMKSSNPEMRFEAVRAAGESFMQSGADQLELLTADPDRDIQLAAITALGQAGRPHSRQVLRRLANSSDEDIRDAAATALEELEFFESVDLDTNDDADLDW